MVPIPETKEAILFPGDVAAALKGYQAKAPTLTLNSCNPYIKTFKDMEYAAKGPVILRAMQIEQELRQGALKPFSKVTKANIGDAHAMGQQPLTFLRQVIALISCPSLITSSSNFPQDVVRKATEILSQCRGSSVGAYTDSRGIELIRKHVASYIQERDKGIPSHPEDIVLSAGASEGIRSLLRLFKSPEKERLSSGVLVPVPEYPLYSATLGEYNIVKIPYYLDEHVGRGWSIDLNELERCYASALSTCNPRAIVIINPGNPTGHLLTRADIEGIIRFAYEKRLFILADEVYQDNVYGGREFLSFKKVLREMPSPYCDSVELVSFYSCSKGYVGECGIRGAYFETVNMDPDVKSVLIATAAAKLCPTVLGQGAVDCSVNPPKEGDESFQTFVQERDNILNNLAERADLVCREFNSMKGISCAVVQGAMYAYPKIDIPEKACIEAEIRGIHPDVFYCLELLENTGICVVPGSGIGQKEGTFHFRTTILCSTEDLKEMLRNFRHFHRTFMETYGGI